LTLFTGKNPSVVQAASGGRHHRVVALGQQHRIAVLHHKNIVESVRVAGSGVGPDKAKAADRLDLKIINLLQAASRRSAAKLSPKAV
jgi:hypothetical protein